MAIDSQPLTSRAACSRNRRSPPLGYGPERDEGPDDGGRRRGRAGAQDHLGDHGMPTMNAVAERLAADLDVRVGLTMSRGAARGSRLQLPARTHARACGSTPRRRTPRRGDRFVTDSERTRASDPGAWQSARPGARRIGRGPCADSRGLERGTEPACLQGSGARVATAASGTVRSARRSRRESGARSRRCAPRAPGAATRADGRAARRVRRPVAR